MNSMNTKLKILTKNSRILTKKLKEFCHKLNNPPTLSWCKLQKNGQKPSLSIYSQGFGTAHQMLIFFPPP